MVLVGWLAIWQSGIFYYFNILKSKVLVHWIEPTARFGRSVCGEGWLVLLLEKSVQWLTTQMSHLYKKTIKEKSFEKVNDPSNVKIRRHVVKNDNTVMRMRWEEVARRKGYLFTNKKLLLSLSWQIFTNFSIYILWIWLI